MASRPGQQLIQERNQVPPVREVWQVATIARALASVGKTPPWIQGRRP